MICCNPPKGKGNTKICNKKELNTRDLNRKINIAYYFRGSERNNICIRVCVCMYVKITNTVAYLTSIYGYRKTLLNVLLIKWRKADFRLIVDAESTLIEQV